MRTFIKMILVLALSFSFASAEMTKEVSRDVIMEVMHSPTKRIVDQEVGEDVIIYEYYPEDNDYWAEKGTVIQKGVEKDKKGNSYRYIIVHVPSDPEFGKYYKLIEHPRNPNMLIVMNGEFMGDPEDREHSFFNMEPGRSWTETEPRQSYGGYGEKDNLKYAAI